MFSSKPRILAVFSACCLLPQAVDSIRRCGLNVCRDDQVCCARGNDTEAVTCCRVFADSAYYNIAMVTRKLSGVLIMLLLFAVGYLVHRALCSRSRRQTPPRVAGAPVAAAASLEPLMESCAPAAAAQLPTYEECKGLPTYEETVRDGRAGQAET